MNDLLTHEEVLEVEVQLLQSHEKKHSLSTYYTSADDECESSFQKNDELTAILNKEYGISQVISCGQDCNSIFRVLTAVLNRVFFVGNQFAVNKKLDRKNRHALLQNLKCTLYSEKLDLSTIRNNPISDLSSKDMKKILVELFQVLKYHQGHPEIILDKYPIVQKIYVLFLRAVLLLNPRGLKDQEINYHVKVQGNSTIDLLLDYFDITYQKRRNLYMMFDDNLYIYINEETGDIAYGQLKGNSSTKSQTQIQQKQFQENFQLKFQEELTQDQKETAVSTPTPCFGQLDDEVMNFNEVSSSARNTYRQSLGQRKKEFCKEIQETIKRSKREKQGMQKQIEKNSQLIYYDKEGNNEKYYDRKLETIPSPLPSTPEQTEQWQNFLNPFQQKCKQKCWEFLPENEEEMSEKEVLIKMHRKQLIRSSDVMQNYSHFHDLKIKKGNSYNQHYPHNLETAVNDQKNIGQKIVNYTNSNKGYSNDCSGSHKSVYASSSIKSRKSSNSTVMKVNFLPSMKSKNLSVHSLHAYPRQAERKGALAQKPKIFFTYYRIQDLNNLQKVNYFSERNSFMKGSIHIQTEPVQEIKKKRVVFERNPRMNMKKSLVFQEGAYI